MNRGQCKDCIFFVVWPEKDQPQPGIIVGACHRYPPVMNAPILANEIYKSVGFVWASTVPHEWCGEFEAREDLCKAYGSLFFCALPEGHEGPHDLSRPPFPFGEPS